MMDLEEIWGKIVEGRGNLSLDTLPDRSKSSLRKLTTEDLTEIYRSEGRHDSPSAFGILAELELKRRENWPARAALVLSIISIFISLVA